MGRTMLCIAKVPERTQSPASPSPKGLLKGLDIPSLGFSGTFLLYALNCVSHKRYIEPNP